MAFNCVYNSLKESWRKDGDPRSRRTLTEKSRSIEGACYELTSITRISARPAWFLPQTNHRSDGAKHEGRCTLRSSQHSVCAQLFELLSFFPVAERSGGADTGSRRVACRDWTRGVITFCCCVHLARFFASHGPVFLHNRCVSEFKKGAIQSICASIVCPLQSPSAPLSARPPAARCSQTELCHFSTIHQRTWLSKRWCKADLRQ